jgi:hypothetical protein
MEQTNIPLVNNQYLSGLFDSHTNEFKNKIEDLSSDIKDNLLEILSLRLSGILPKKQFENYSLEWSSVQFNKYTEYFDEFNNKYFSLEKFTNDNIDDILHKNIFNQISKIKSIYENFNNLDKLNIKVVKKIMVLTCKLSENYDTNVNLLQYILIINGIKEFIQIISTLYPNSLDYMYDKITTKLNKKMNFNDIVNIFISIVKKYLHNFILLNKHLLDKEIIDNLLSEYYKIEKNVKCIFWIVYHNELKYYDDIIKLYNIDYNLISSQLEKLDYNFDENKEFMNSIETTANFLSEILSSNVKNKLDEFKKNNVTTVSDEMIKSTIDDLIDDLIDDEIESIIKTHLSDPDEIIIIKSQLGLSKEMIKLNLTLDDTFDFLMKVVGKK